MKTTITRTIESTNYTAVTVDITLGQVIESSCVIVGKMSESAILKLEQKTDTDALKTVAIKDIYTTEHVYTVDLETFIEHAKRVNKRTSVDSITRTIPITVYQAMKVNITDQTVTNIESQLVGAVTDETALLKALQKDDTDNMKTVHATILTTTESLYELSQSAFLSIAERVK